MASTPSSGRRADRVAVFARAKVNLTLHVRARRADGLHELDSLVVFPAIGDTLEAEPSAAGLSLAIDGPFAGDLDAGGDNLVLRAAELLREASGPGAPPGAALRLVKRLPVASGIGGGSSDAAAAFLALRRLWTDRSDALALAADLEAMAARLGADIPVCLRQPATMLFEGLGDVLTPGPALPPFWMVLANPGEALPTAEVFRARPDPRGAGPAAPDAFADLGALTGWLEETRNDLAPVAERLRPTIRTVREALADLPGCEFARMSGSGASCFGLFDSETAALEAERALQARHPAWWVAAGPVGGDEAAEDASGRQA